MSKKIILTLFIILPTHLKYGYLKLSPVMYNNLIQCNHKNFLFCLKQIM